MYTKFLQVLRTADLVKKFDKLIILNYLLKITILTVTIIQFILFYFFCDFFPDKRDNKFPFDARSPRNIQKMKIFQPETICSKMRQFRTEANLWMRMNTETNAFYIENNENIETKNKYVCIQLKYHGNKISKTADSWFQTVACNSRDFESFFKLTEHGTQKQNMYGHNVW